MVERAGEHLKIHSIPFQAWPGNHETDDNHCDFLNYRARFYNQNLTADTATNARGVRSRNSRYYSFEIPGLLHVAGIDTDAYAEPDVDTDGNGASGQSFFVAEQWQWLEKVRPPKLTVALSQSSYR